MGDKICKNCKYRKPYESDIQVEIRDTGHIEWYEASKSTEITKEEVEKAVFEKGYIADNVVINFDEKEKLWKAYGNIQDIERFKVGSYSITQINSYEFEITYEGAYSAEKKTICGGDLETVLSTIFIQKVQMKMKTLNGVIINTKNKKLLMRKIDMKKLKIKKWKYYELHYIF